MTLPTVTRLIVLFSILAIPSMLNGQSDWSRWRGPEGNGIAASQKPPFRWNSTENVIWKVKVPGRGHASPTIADGKIFLATADKDKQSQSVICYQQKTGKLLWETEVNQGGLPGQIHRKNTYASSTVATDGEHLFAVFNNHGNIHVTALDFDGKEIWTKEVGSYEPAFPFGYGASPIVHGDQVIVTNEGGMEAAIIAYDTKTGEQKWKLNRNGSSSFSTPVVATLNGKEQLLLSGARTVMSYDPSTGDKNWSANAIWQVTCGTLVWDNANQMVFASGGFPANQTLGIDASNGNKVWDNPAKVYEQSMLVHDGYLYAHSDNGVIYCWRAEDGQEMWKQKFSNSRVAVSASPVLANGMIYFTAENGETVVVNATHEGYEEISRNQLGDEAFASQAICGNRIYARIADSSGGSRQEWLYCLGEKQK